MKLFTWLIVPVCFLAALILAASLGQAQDERLYTQPLNVKVPPLATDKTVKYDYDIVYVRVPRADEKDNSVWTEIGRPAHMSAGGDLVLLHPDGSEEVLVKAGAEYSVTDPFVSFDGETVYYSLLHLAGAHEYGPGPQGADIYKIHVPSRKVTRLTRQEYTPNTGAADWSRDYRTPEEGKSYLPYGVLNMGPCPLPGGKVIFTSSRNAFKPPRHNWPVQQLFVMDDDGGNVECIGHLNLGMALHPVILKDGRVMFSSLENQGIRNPLQWGIWSIHPDGTNWGPIFSGFTSIDSLHFQTQLTDTSLVIEQYYNMNQLGFGAYWKVPAQPPEGQSTFASAHGGDPRLKWVRFSRFPNGKGMYHAYPFQPVGADSLTRFTHPSDTSPGSSVLEDPASPQVGKFAHPSGAPDNHLLTTYYPGFRPIDAGIYLIKDGQPIDEPAQMRLIKNDPKYQEQWPRALVSYKRIYGVDEPARLPPLANDGKLSTFLPEGTPFGLVGTSSMYKRESYPGGKVPEGKVTATYPGGSDPWKGLDAFTSHGTSNVNWIIQGAEAGLYENSQVHAIRILVMEPTTDRWHGPRPGRLFYNHPTERLRILGEIPVRKFPSSPSEQGKGEGGQPLDPDGNPDTSFLARMPADTVYTFQTLDRKGMVLNSSQTWHQLRPGEIRHDCGGCHAHSQKPTLFKDTAAARPDYEIWDLVQKTPLVTSRELDQTGKKWDTDEETGIRFAKGVYSVEYWRDIRPILDRSCVACHTKKWKEPAGNLVLDDDDRTAESAGYGPYPGTYTRLALDNLGKFGHKPVGWPDWGYFQATRYIRKMQARRSLLVWKIYGRRLDGWHNDDHPSESRPGAGDLVLKGKPVDPNALHYKTAQDIDYSGSWMPPEAAVEGTYQGPDGKRIKVEPLSHEDRRTIVRWIDLGCPIDLDYSPAKPQARGHGWMCDDNRPTLTLTYPTPGVNPPLTSLLVGMHDYYSGLDLSTFQVVADFPVDGVAAGQNLAPRFKSKDLGIWELQLARPINELKKGKIVVLVKDRQGNVARIERTISIGSNSSP